VIGGDLKAGNFERKGRKGRKDYAEDAKGIQKYMHDSTR
jgi:hypothetical protein